MHHVAIMSKSWGLIPKILSGGKTIESRWYQTRRAPWGRVEVGDTIFFKNTGEGVSAQASVLRVEQIELGGISDTIELVKQYGKDICLPNHDPQTWGRVPRYCILMWLSSPIPIQPPFEINKKGFGGPVAWITTQDILSIKK